MADRNRPIDAPPVPRFEDPAALAARLAADAKARLAAGTSGLAASAPPPGRHNSLAAAAPPPARPRPAAPPPVEDVEGDEFSSVAAEPARKVRKARPPEPTPPPPPLTARAAPKRLSAAEAIARAMEEEKRAAEAPPPAPVAPAAAAPAPPPAAPQPPPAQQRAAVAPDQVVRAVLPSASVGQSTAVQSSAVLRALFQAHRARAVMTHDLALLSASSVLVDAADRVPAGRLHALRVGIAGADYAVFVDTDRGALLAVLAPPDLYLAGL